MGLIKSARELVNAAVRQIEKYQKGEDKPIKTEYEHLNKNCLGGIYSDIIITIAGVSGHGKSYILQKIEENIFNTTLNPDCENYILLRCNWEMSVFKLLIRKLNRKLKKKISYILQNVLVGEELAISKSVCDSERDGRIFNFEEPTDPNTWYEEVKAFAQSNKDKKRIIVTIDHIALVKDVFNSKTKAMGELVENINLLRKQFNNLSFIIISQLNREIENRTDIRSLAPRRQDLYQSDTMFHISDIVVVVHNPYLLGYNKYMVVNPKKYPHLKKYMDNPDKAQTSFVTDGIVFWHYLKVRDKETDYNSNGDVDIDYYDIAVEEINFTPKNIINKEEFF